MSQLTIANSTATQQHPENEAEAKPLCVLITTLTPLASSVACIVAHYAFPTLERASVQLAYEEVLQEPLGACGSVAADVEEIVCFAVARNGCELYNASKNQRNNKKVVILAVNQNPGAICFASPRLQKHPDVLEAARLSNERRDQDYNKFRKLCGLKD